MHEEKMGNAKKAKYTKTFFTFKTDFHIYFAFVCIKRNAHKNRWLGGHEFSNRIRK